MDFTHHPDTAKTCKSIASNTNAVMCAVCGSKQYIKACPRDHHHIDPVFMAEPGWLRCADAFGKSCSSIQPLFSSPSLIKPLYGNTALLQTPPNVFHSHSSVGVRMVPSSNPSLNKEKKDTTVSSEAIHNSESSLNQSARKKQRPGSRPKSRAGYENLDKTSRANPPPQFVTVPGEPSCCQVPCRPHVWQNCCSGLIPYPYQPLAYPIPQIIPVYVPVPHDCEGNRSLSCETTSCQTEKDFNDETEEMNDYDFEKLAKELVMEQGFNSGDENEVETNLDLLVNKFESGMNVEKIIGEDDKENDEKVNSSVKSQGDCNESKNAYNEDNDKDEWSSNENFPEKEVDNEEEKWAEKSIDKEVSDLSSCSGSHKYSKAGEETDALAFTSYKPNIKSESNIIKNMKAERPLSKEKGSMTDFQEKGVKSSGTAIQMILDEYDYEEEKNEENCNSHPESLAESDDGNNGNSQKSEAAVSIKQEYDENLIIEKYENEEKGDSEPNLEKDNLSDENNESDEENSEEKYENTSENLIDTFNFEEPTPVYQDNKKEGYKVINVYKKEVVTDDVKEDWLDTEEEIMPPRKESFENTKNRSAIRERVLDQNEPVHYLHCKDNRREMIKVNHDETENNVKIRKRVEEKDDSHYSYKKANIKDSFSPRLKSKIGVHSHEQASGERVKGISNKLIYTAIINKKEEKEKEKIDVSPLNSPRWREEVKKVTKRPEGKKRWMI